MKEVEEKSERRRLETQVIESQKMEVISQFSSRQPSLRNKIILSLIFAPFGTRGHRGDDESSKAHS
jgi:hypothetical protein